MDRNRTLRDLAQCLEAHSAKIVTAESCTGGAIACALTSVSGASRWFEMGFVTYSNTAKTTLLDVPFGLIQQFGAVSDEVARSMLNGALGKSGASLGIAATGIAGPEGGTDTKPVGTVFLAWGGLEDSQCTRFHFEGDRERVRSMTVDQSLKLVLMWLQRRLG